MAITFPGVSASNDNENDIVIRGNSPSGLSWRLEGVEIANPNHFARKGSSGGGITIFSLSLMGQSDFSVGAFAPEYGNAFAGVFDMKFRRGNRDKHEFTGRAGFIGLDLASEGPIQKGKSSYLVNYRYSTLALLRKMGVRFTGPGTSNVFQDLSFNLAFKTSQNGTLTVFGAGGISDEKHYNTSDTSTWKAYGDFMQYDFFTKTGATGFTYTHLLDEKSYVKFVGVASAVHILTVTDTVNLFRRDTATVGYDNSTEGKMGGTFFYHRKISSRFTFQTGLYANRLFYNVFTTKLPRFSSTLDTVTLGKGGTFLAQPYLQMRFRLTEKMTFTGGLHSLFHLIPVAAYGTPKNVTLEPRLAMSYAATKTQTFTLAYGLHSQLLPLGTYFYKNETASSAIPVNIGLKPIRAHHLVTSYNRTFSSNIRLKTEAYFQYLYHLPVSQNAASTYATLNDREGYGQVPLTSQGFGRNMGIDVTFEKFFSNRFFFLLAGSLYDSKYKPLDKQWYNTRYNGRYLSSFMCGKEWQFKNAATLEIGTRIMYNGGQRYTPANDSLSALTGVFVPDEKAAYSLISKSYFRIDGRIAYRKSHKKYSSVVSLDMLNVSNHPNFAAPTYNQVTGQLQQWGQSGFTPILSYMVDF